MKNAFILILLIKSLVVAYSQNTHPLNRDTTTSMVGNISIGGYIDTYYSYYSRNPDDDYAPYLVNSSRKNSIAVNLAYIEVQYNSENVRVRLAPGFGTYMNLNYANEPGTLKNIVEGYVGVRLSEKRNVWLDAGIFGSPYTNESPVSKDHLMYTRSLAAEYSPYYLSGAKLSFPLADRWKASFFLLNGWQVIDDTNSRKSLGTQIEYRHNDKMTFHWNTYLGDERSGSQQDYRTRLFTDLFWIHKLNDHWDFTADAYVGLQKFDGRESKMWWQANGVARYTFTPKSSLAGRFEVFRDGDAVVAENEIAEGVGFIVYSSGLCYNYKIHRNALFRVEGRYFFTPDTIFLDDDGLYKQSALLSASLSAWF
jgi:Putative beta-barrel porin-2, OmpL-like. bbp2